MPNLDNMMQMADDLATSQAIQPLTDLIAQIMALPDDLDDTGFNVIRGAMQGALDQIDMDAVVQGSIEEFEADGYTKAKLTNTIKTLKDSFADVLNGVAASENKRKILDIVFNKFYDILDMVAERFHTYDIELPIMLDEGAQMPTYAHESDACADVYAYEDQVIPAHSRSNKIRTGLHFAIPEGWEIGLLPRSSIGSKTGLRLSNSRAVVDQLFRDEMMILYDNISDSDYTIKAGDRIAQMFVQPTYRFKGVVVNKEQFDSIEGNRGGGLGSTGK